jgi:hypothetical protein
MKKILTLFLLCLNTFVYGQYSSLTVIPNDRSVICSLENIDDNNFGFYVSPPRYMPQFVMRGS